jgi:hypothetical protein
MRISFSFDVSVIIAQVKFSLGEKIIYSLTITIRNVEYFSRAAICRVQEEVLAENTLSLSHPMKK